MPDKKSFKQTMGQEKVDKKKVIRLVVLSVVGLVLLTVLFMAIGGKDEESAAPETVSTPMVPTSLRYYDPMSEETYETGVNYVILNQSDGSRIRVSDDGRVVEIDDAGNVVREISNGADYISTGTGLMKSDNQVAMAMAGLQTSLESEEPDVNGFDLFEQDFLDYIDRKGWDFNDVMSTLYSAGYGPDELYALQDKGVAWQSVVDDVVKNASQQTQKDEEPTISGNQTTTGPTQVTLENEKDTTSSTSSDLPSWLQPIDVNGTMNALVDSLVATTGTGTTSASRTAYEQQNRQAEKVNRQVDCLLQLHIAREETKFGFSFDECREMLAAGEWRNLHYVRICGLMGMATNTDNMEQVKDEFRSLSDFFREVKETWFKDEPSFREVSMGMSHDYHEAIAEGSTLVRIGTHIFGERIY